MTLARDIFGIWHLADTSNTYAATTDLLHALHSHAPERWGASQPHGRTPLTPQGMGRMLTRNYGIHSTRQRADGPRGYQWGQFEDAWRALGLTGLSGTCGAPMADAHD